MRPDAEKLIEASEDDLYRMIGEIVLGKAAVPRSPQHLIEAAKQWMENKRREITHAICSSPAVRKAASQKLAAHEIAVLASEVAESLTRIVTGQDLPILVSVLLLRHGVHALCRDVWEDE